MISTIERIASFVIEQEREKHDKFTLTSSIVKPTSCSKRSVDRMREEERGGH